LNPVRPLLETSESAELELRTPRWNFLEQKNVKYIKPSFIIVIFHGDFNATLVFIFASEEWISFIFIC
jgi:hypothetical protein